MRLRVIAAAAAVLVGAPAMSQLGQQQMLDYARGIAKMVGMSPEGTELYARRSLEMSSADQYDRVSAVEIAIGQELARPTTTRDRLAALVEQYAVESAAVARRRKSREMELALELSQADRQTLGRFLEQSTRQSLANSQRIARPRP